MGIISDDKNRLILIEIAEKGKTIREAMPALGIEKSAIHMRLHQLIRDGYMTGRKGSGGRYLAREFRLTEKGERFIGANGSG